jgi:hypothetical protein
MITPPSDVRHSCVRRRPENDPTFMAHPDKVNQAAAARSGATRLGCSRTKQDNREKVVLKP